MSYSNNRKIKKDLKPVNINIDKKIEIIASELEILKPETLLENVDPSIDELQTIKQIQHFYDLIHQEMVSLVRK